ncbi:tetratricopeptide repeat protein [Dapis sp. BLCC M229]|uniref:tetratricopeptide repeat protein n=1 Tax=Dapis sp. BLCC M229 TaxID=3400188 RepID=UPI003CF10979
MWVKKMTTGDLIIQGNKLKREGKLDEAIALYIQAIELNPGFAFTYYELGDGLEKQGYFAKASIEYEKAIELNPNVDFFHQSLETIKSRKLEQSLDVTSNQINSDFVVVGISMIKNEEDILETFIRHNLNYLDFLVLADNGSTHNSRKIINKLIQESLNLCVIDDDKMAYTQTDKMTNLYRRVATSFFPEFIVPIDADELIQSPSQE